MFLVIFCQHCDDSIKSLCCLIQNHLVSCLLYNVHTQMIKIYILIRTQRSFNVYTTSITLGRRRINVKMTLCAYWYIPINIRYKYLYTWRKPLKEDIYASKSPKLLRWFFMWTLCRRIFYKNEEEQSVKFFKRVYYPYSKLALEFQNLHFRSFYSYAI